MLNLVAVVLFASVSADCKECATFSQQSQAPRATIVRKVKVRNVFGRKARCK